MSEDFSIPKHLQSTKYIESKIKSITKSISEKVSLDFYTKKDLENTIFAAEQIALVCRAELSERSNTEINPILDESVASFNDIELVYEDGVYSITVPVTVDMATNHSWYLATLTRKAVKKYVSEKGNISFSQPMITVCERVIPKATTSVKDNDNFEVHRIINEFLLQCGQGDHPLRMTYYSTVSVIEGKRFTKISFMNTDNFLKWWQKNIDKNTLQKG